MNLTLLLLGFYYQVCQKIMIRSFFRRRGESIETEQKFGAATNKHTGTTLNTTKLDRETEELKHERVPLELGKAIMKGRNDKVKHDSANLCKLPEATCRNYQIFMLLQ